MPGTATIRAAGVLCWRADGDDVRVLLVRRTEYKDVSLPKGKQIVIDAKTGQATTNVENFQGDLDKLPKSKAVTVKGTVDLSSITNTLRNYRPNITVRANVTDRFGRPLK